MFSVDTIYSVLVSSTSKNDSDEDVDRFYEDLQAVLSSIKDKDPIIVMGDFNAKVG